MLLIFWLEIGGDVVRHRSNTVLQFWDGS